MTHLARTVTLKVGTQPFGPAYEEPDMKVGDVFYITQVCEVWTLHKEWLQGSPRIEITVYEPGVRIAADRR